MTVENTFRQTAWWMGVAAFTVGLYLIAESMFAGGVATGAKSIGQFAGIFTISAASILGSHFGKRGE